MREQQIRLIPEPAEFEASAGNRAVLDLGPVVIGHELAATDLAKHLPLVGQAACTLFDAADEQIRRAAIDRHVVDVGLGPGAVDDRLVVAGDESVIFPEPRDSQRQKTLFEEGSRLGAIGNIESFGRAAGIAQRNAQGLVVGGQVSLRGDRPAAHAKCLVGLQVVVLAPARDIGPCDRNILAAADLKRPGETRIWDMASNRQMRTRIMDNTRMRGTGGNRGKRRGRQRDGDHTTCGGGSPQVTRVSEHFPCQPASSSDRVR